MTTSAPTTDHRGHGCPDDPTWDPETQTFRTPELVALEVALAKAHYYGSTDLEEQIARYERLVTLEEELEAVERQAQIDADVPLRLATGGHQEALIRLAETHEGEATRPCCDGDTTMADWITAGFRVER